MEGILGIVISAIALVIAELVPQHDDLEFLEPLVGMHGDALDLVVGSLIDEPVFLSSRMALVAVTHPTGLSPASGSRPALELVAGGGRLDQPPDQPAAAKREWWEHVRAAIASHPGLGRGLVVRILLRKTPYPSRHRTLRGEATSAAGGGCPVRSGTSRRRSPCDGQAVTRLDTVLHPFLYSGNDRRGSVVPR
jgi:hypothetical protein